MVPKSMINSAPSAGERAALNEKLSKATLDDVLSPKTDEMMYPQNVGRFR